ncbi:DinB family protein [Alkaliphilus serpentinus]|uniref:DinB family protein n=1 Tax=Alkaliphilus serpentinus TaxID=1482731 RepID=A0A833HN20_9FIRM|nr:DinB family protein [Alkaliphilus serpentinus]KAB3529175.1 DinB family protein [Alkaliphilus serpentinus]
MMKNYESLYKEWQFIRSCSISFINELRDEDLDKELPRKGLNTFRKHFEEMINIEKDFIKAIETKVMRFSDISDSDIKGKMSKKVLISTMEMVDATLSSALEALEGEEYIEWGGEKQSLSFYLAFLISHESMHVGQIIAFCYALDIDIPQYVVKNWALSGK